MPIQRIAVSAGEPAGIGPELLIQLAQQHGEHDGLEIIALADPELLEQRARALELPLTLQPVNLGAPPAATGRSTLRHLPPSEAPRLAVTSSAGQLSAANVPYVLECLRQGVALCRSGFCSALVTAPVHKGIINDAGIPFTGHTEWLAEACNSPAPLMLLVAGTLRVALATTHLPLRAVPDAITPDRLEHALTLLDTGLARDFNIPQPRIAVAGLNPHAGEAGHLGLEERDIISPVVQRLHARGMRLVGPLPADTLFTPRQLQDFDAVLCMYHDQGLPVLKHAGFGHAVNITLGLPIVRTSVDHGTALALAGTGRADPGSLFAAVQVASEIARRRGSNP